MIVRSLLTTSIQTASETMKAWKTVIPSLLHVLLEEEADPVLGRTRPRSESPSPPPLIPCQGCQIRDLADRTSTTSVRCLDCMFRAVRCGDCTIKDHARHPLHRIEQWTGTHFERSSLEAVGMKLHLGHGGMPCSEWKEGVSVETKLTVTHTNGLHVLTVRWCCCIGRPGRAAQLLQHGLFPGSPDEMHVRSAYTIEVLRTFHLHSLESNEAGKDFFNVLLRLTNNVFPDEVKVSERSVMTRSKLTADIISGPL